MTQKILDTSVVVKWFIEEKDSDIANKYLKEIINGKYEVVFPSLIFYELGNACLYNHMSTREIGKVIEKLAKFPIQVEDIGFSAMSKIYQNAVEYNLSFYDASYVTLMQKYDCELITADEKMFNKLKNTFTKVKLLHSSV